MPCHWLELTKKWKLCIHKHSQFFVVAVVVVAAAAAAAAAVTVPSLPPSLLLSLNQTVLSKSRRAPRTILEAKRPRRYREKERPEA